MATVEADIEKLLRAENAEFTKDLEIDRILAAFKLDAYAVLDILPGCTTKDIRNIFRKKSLLIHPDKTTNVKAPEAFDKLKKAESELVDDKTRERLDSTIAVARRMLIDERKWTNDHPDLQTDAFTEALRDKTRQLLIEDELQRRRKRALQMAEEGRVRQEEEAAALEAKRKMVADKIWDQSRDERVGGWRKFTGQDKSTPPPPPPPLDGGPIKKRKVKKTKPVLLG